ncbi:MAG: adenylate/guanylate cyclase domain-containing protein [Hyphomicrobium sp.]
MTQDNCPSCGAAVPQGSKFCGECGLRLAPAAAAQTEAAPVPSPPAPAQPSPSQRDEFRDVTVLFADVTGFTQLSERLDPEALHALMNDCFVGLGRIVQAHGGHIDKYIGDSIMALFGAPTAHDDDPLRAGEAALDMQRFLTAFAASHTDAGGCPFQMRIGINSGLVLAGSIGTEGKRDYSVMGDAVNTAARLEGQARPGSILVSADFKRRVDRHFAFGPEQAFALKGKEKPVAAFELLGDAQENRTSSATARPRPFAGRARERAVIESALKAVAGGASRWLDVRGPLGIGKSHLVEAALSGRSSRTALWIVARPATRMRPFALARRLLFAVYQRGSGDTGPPLTREAFAAALIPNMRGLEPYLNALWYLAAPDALNLKTPDPDPLTFRRTLEGGLKRLLANVAAAEPRLVIVLDAYDLADTETQNFFESAWLSSSRALPSVVTTSRQEGAPLRQSTGSLTLDRMPPADAEHLVALIAGAKPLGPNMVRNILARADGVPLFIIELVRKVQEDAGASAVDEALATPALPSSLLGVMISRLDRLEPERREALAQCAVQGVDFSRPVALNVWLKRGGTPEALGGHLADLEHRHIVQSQDRDGQRYAFTQALMQNACYDSMLKRDRRALHRDVAAALVAETGGAQGVSPELLATHYELSEQWLEAAGQNARAGSRAAELYSNADALARFARALKALREHDSGTENERKIAYAVYRGAAQVHLRIGSYLDLESDAQEMMRLAHSVEERAEAGRLMAQGRLHRGDLESAEHFLSEARVSLAVKTPAADTHSAQGLAPATPRDGTGVACHILYDLADLSFRRGNNKAARDLISECRAIVISDCPELLRLDILEGRVAHTEGRFHDAVTLYERAHGAAAGAGSLSEEALTSNYMGNAARDVGHYEDAERYFARALEIWTRVGLTESMAGAHNNLANLAISRGDARRAEHHYSLALEAFEHISNAAGTALALTNLSILAIEEGRADKAIRNAAQAKALLLSSGNRMLLALAGVVHGEALLAAGRPHDAHGEFAWIRENYDESNHPLAIAGALRGQGRAELARMDAEAALGPLVASLALYERLARQQEAGRTELYLSEAYRLSGDRAKASRCLSSARTRFKTIGAVTDLARAELLTLD